MDFEMLHILKIKYSKKIRMNSKPIKTEVGPKSLSYDEICNLIINFNPEIDNYTEQIESPKAGDVYSLDKNKLDDWKSGQTRGRVLCM
jgi:hypothetical protein